MFFLRHGIVEPGELALLRAVLDSHCVSHGISDDASREVAAMRLIVLFDRGIRHEEELLLRLSDRA